MPQRCWFKATVNDFPRLLAFVQTQLQRFMFQSSERIGEHLGGNMDSLLNSFGVTSACKIIRAFLLAVSFYRQIHRGCPSRYHGVPSWLRYAPVSGSRRSWLPSNHHHKRRKRWDSRPFLPGTFTGAWKGLITCLVFFFFFFFVVVVVVLLVLLLFLLLLLLLLLRRRRRRPPPSSSPPPPSSSSSFSSTSSSFFFLSFFFLGLSSHLALSITNYSEITPHFWVGGGVGWGGVGGGGRLQSPVKRYEKVQRTI